MTRGAPAHHSRAVEPQVEQVGAVLRAGRLMWRPLFEPFRAWGMTELIVESTKRVVERTGV